MSKFMILMYKDGVPTERHVLETPGVTEPGFYRQTLSLNYFSDREAKRLYHQHKKGILDVEGKRCWVRWHHEYTREIECSKDFFEKNGLEYVHEFSGKPEFQHTSVWDFYKAIGYDYKKKKYVDQL